MTNEEAINVLKNTAWLGTEKDREEVKKALETLSNTSEIPNSSDDLINRQAAINAIRNMCEECDGDYCGECRVGRKDCEKVLEELPSAQPEQDREFMKLTVRNSNGRPYYSIIYLEFDDNGIGNDFEGYSSYSLDVISDYLKKYFMPSAQPEQHWIPCSERLPDTNRDVLLQFKTNMGVGFWENGEWGVNTGDNIYSEIGEGEAKPIAWMELPEPYRGGES